MSTVTQPEGYPSLVYKYVTQDRIDVLQNLTIRFTQPSALNDPFELNPLFDQLIPDEMMEKEFNLSSDGMKAQLAISLKEEYNKQPRTIRRRLTFQQFLARLEANPELVKDGFEKIMPSMKAVNRSMAPAVKAILAHSFSRIGILSLSSSLTNPALWAHYAEKSTGFVCEFDASHAFFDKRRSSNDDLLHLRNVNYRDRESVNRSLYDVDADQLFYTKGRSWAYEAEWRIVAPLEQAKTRLIVKGEQIYLFEIPALAITRVIVGANASSELIAKIKNLIDSRDELSHIEMNKIQINLESHCLDVCTLVA
jgi:hypothetical protein